MNRQVNLFVAPGSNGKTTISVRLAQAGATILSEDHIVLGRDADGAYWVSGCQDTLRVTEKTERLFAKPLLRDAVDAAGGPKKEFHAREFFRAAPFKDFAFHRIFFNHLGTQFRITPIARQSAQLQLMHMTRSFFRPDDSAEMARYLEFWSGVVQGRACFDLELSPDLGTLDGLVRFLSR